MEAKHAWTLYSRQEHRLNAFHLRCLRRLLGITWQDRVTNKDVLAQAGISSMFCHANAETTALAGPCLPHGPDGPHSKKDVLYGELATGSRPTGRPALRYKDVCKRDLRGRRRRSSGPGNSILRPRQLADHREGWHRRSRTDERDQMGRTAAQETAETTFSTQQHPGQHVYLQQLQQTLPLKDWDCTVTAGVATLPQINPRRKLP